MQATERPDPAVRIRAIASVPDAILYRDVIQPILESRCYDCHSSAKEKGDLRLDKEEFIQKGGKHGPVIKAGPADSSAIFKRLMLPLQILDRRQRAFRLARRTIYKREKNRRHHQVNAGNT
jgi:hypothetical protein